MARKQTQSELGIELSGSKCIVCDWAVKGANGELLVEGAHIRPHSSGDEFDVFRNIVGFCPNHHTEFDHFNFFIDPKNKTLVFRDTTNPYNGKNVCNYVAHVEERFLTYAQIRYNKKEY